MANIKAFKKHASISKIRRKKNASKRSIIKTFMKKVFFFIKEGKKEKAYQAYTVVQPIIDKYSTKRIIHPNKAARYKSNLMSIINKM